MLTVHYLNFDNSSYPTPTSVPDGKTLSEFVSERTGRGMADFAVKVNQETQPGSYVLRDGDEVAVAPKKVEGGLSS
jgi:molybdopterin converting factor small subunit